MNVASEDVVASASADDVKRVDSEKENLDNFAAVAPGAKCVDWASMRKKRRCHRRRREPSTLASE